LKKIISVIVLIIVVIVAFKIKSIAEISPYKDAVNSFVSTLKQGNAFAVQEKLEKKMQRTISVEDIIIFIEDTSTAHIKKISWGDYELIDGNCTILANLIEEDDSKLPARFGLYLDDKQDPVIFMLQIGNLKLKPEKQVFK